MRYEVKITFKFVQRPRFSINDVLRIKRTLLETWNENDLYAFTIVNMPPNTCRSVALPADAHSRKKLTYIAKMPFILIRKSN